MDLMALSIPIKVDDKQALAAFKDVERTAAKLTVSLSQASAALKTLGIDAKTASVNGIERIVVNARQLDQANQLLGKMGANFRAVAQEATRAATATEKVARVGSVGYQKWGNAAVRASGALMLMDDALSGNDKSAQQLLKTGSSIAFMFGPAGAVVGAFGIAASMIVGAMDKSRKAIEAVKKATDDLIASGKEMSDAPGFASLGAARGQSFKMGLRLAELVDQLEALEEMERKFQQSSKIAIASGIQTPLTRSFDVEQIASLKTQIANLRVAYTEVVKLTGVLSTYEATQNKANVAAAQMRFNTPGSIGLSGTGLGRIQGGAFGGLGQGAAGSVAANQASAAAAMAEGLKDPAIQAILDTEAAISDAVDTHIVGGIGNALHEGFARAFSGEGIGGLLKGFTSSLVGSLGQMFIELGKHLISFGTIMTALKKALTTALGSGPGAVVAGVALVALGAAMSAGAGAIMGGRSSGGSSGYSAGSSGAQGIADSTTTYRYNPQTMDLTKVNPMQPVHFTVIGTNDIKAQNDIAEMVRRAQRRGG